MVDPFAAGLEALFKAPGSAAAVLGDDQPLRVIRHQPTLDLAFNDTTVPVASNSVMIRRSDVNRPVRGMQLQVGSFAGVAQEDPVFRIAGEPRLDVEGLTWTCELEPVR